MYCNSIKLYLFLWSGQEQPGQKEQVKWWSTRETREIHKLGMLVDLVCGLEYGEALDSNCI